MLAHDNTGQREQDVGRYDDSGQVSDSLDSWPDHVAIYGGPPTLAVIGQKRTSPALQWRQAATGTWNQQAPVSDNPLITAVDGNLGADCA